MENPFQPLQFKQVRDLHQKIGGDSSINDFSQLANRLTQSQAFDAGTGNMFDIGVKRGSAAIDDFLDTYAGPVNSALGTAGEKTFDFFGADPATGRQVGEEALRGFVDFLPAIAGYALSPVTGGASAFAGTAITAAMSGANAYEKSDSLGQAALAAGLAATGGKITEMGATTALRQAAKMPALKALGIHGGEKVLGAVNNVPVENLIARAVGDRVLGAVAGEAAVNVTSMVAQSGLTLAETGEFTNPFSKEAILSNLVDPTILFGVRELITPSVISSRAIKEHEVNKRVGSAELEEFAKKQETIVPSLEGKNLVQLEEAYREFKLRLKEIPDDKLREATRIQLEEAHAEARKNLNGTAEIPTGTLFGETLVTKLDDELTKPNTRSVAQDDGTVVEVPVVLKDLMDEESFAAWEKEVKGKISEEGAIRLIELDEMDSPKNRDEYEDGFVKMNAVRQELGGHLLDDAWFQEKIEKRVKDGDSVEVATDKVFEIAKAETQVLADKAIEKAGELVESVEEGRAVEQVEKTEEQKADPYVSDAIDSVNELLRDTFQPIEGRIEPGSPEALIKKAATARAFRENVTTSTRKKPTGGKKNPIADASVVSDEKPLNMKRKITTDEDDPLYDVAGFGYDDDGEELAFFPDGVQPLVKQRPKGDEGLNTVLADVLSVDDETGNLVFGNKSQMVSKGKVEMPERIVEKWLSRMGVGSRTWQAYKLAYPDLVTEKTTTTTKKVQKKRDGKIVLEDVTTSTTSQVVNVERLKEVAGKELVKVEVHGQAGARNPGNRMAEIQHAVDTNYPGFSLDREMDGEFTLWYNGEDLTPSNYPNNEWENNDGYAVTVPDELHTLMVEYADLNENNQASDKDFAARHGFVAPDNFEPFDPKTGLGNVAYELRVPGVKGGGNHTGNEDTLAWVRGKFIAVPDAQKVAALELEQIAKRAKGESTLLGKGDEWKTHRKVFRIDEVQSDAAQRHSKNVTAAQKSITLLDRGAFELRADSVLDTDTMQEVYFPSDASLPGVSVYSAKSKEGAAQEAKKVLARTIEYYSEDNHPFFDSYEALALRTAIQKARENGAEEIFIPDGETAMMSEGHDRAAKRPISEVYMIEQQAMDKVDSLTRLGYVDTKITQVDSGWRVDAIGGVSQSKGMTDAYDRRLPQTTEKLLGVKGERNTLGVHNKGPSPVFKETVQNRALPGAQVAVQSRIGAGKSSVTGRTYSLATKGFDDITSGFEAQRATRHDIFERTLRKQGVSNAFISQHKESFTKMFDLFDANDVQVFELMDQSVRGAATIKGDVRKMFIGDKGLENLSDKDRVRAVMFVAGHELGHLVENSYNQGTLSQRHHDAFTKFDEWTKTATVADRKLTLELMRDGFLPKEYRESDVVKTAMNATGKPEEVRANLMSMWAMSQAQKPDVMAMNLMPRSIVKGFRVLSDLGKSIIGAMRGSGKVMETFMGMQKTRANLDDMVKFLDTIKRAEAEHEAFYTEGMRLATYGEVNYRETIALFNEDEPKFVVPAAERNAVQRAFDNWLQPFNDLTAQVPEFKRINAALYNFPASTKAGVKRIVGTLIGELDASGKPILDINGNPQFSSHDGKMHYESVKNKPELNKAYSDWLRAQNVYVKEDKTLGKPLTLEELRTSNTSLHQRLMRMSESDRNAVVQMVHKTRAANQQAQRETLRVTELTNESVVKSYLDVKLPGMWKDNAGIANALYQGTKNLRSQDPSTQEAGRIALQQVATMIGPVEFQRAYDIASKGADSFDDLVVQFAQAPHFASEARFGKIFLHWTQPNGKSGGLAFDNVKDAQAYEQKLRDRGVTAITVEKTRRGQAYLFGQDSLLERLKEHDERGKAAVDSTDIDEATKEYLKAQYNSAWDFERDFAASKIVKQGSARGFKEGREELDMMSTQIQYWNALMRTLNKKLLHHEMNHERLNPAWADPRVQERLPQLDQMIDNYFVPDTELGTSVSTFNAAYFLGGNIASHIVETTQGFATFVPELVNRGDTWFQANKRLLTIMNEVGRFTAMHIPSQAKKALGNKVNLKILQGVDDPSFWKDPNHADLMRFAVENDAISMTHASDIIEPDLSGNVDLSSIIARGGEKSDNAVVKYGINPAKHVAKLSLKFYQNFTEFNSRVSLIAGYEQAKDQGLSHQAAMESALEFSRLASFSGGKLNRTNKLNSGSGSYRTLGQMLMSLNGYTFGAMSMMRRFAETGYSKKQYPNLSEEQRKNARRALKTMVATQFLGAGALGMPFVGAAAALLEKMTGVELERDMREGLAQLFQEDEEEGGLFSEMVMSGAANGVLGKMLPGTPDIGSRLSLGGGVLGTSAYDGFSAGDIFGASGSVVENVAKGITSLAKDRNPAQAMEDVFPVAMKKMIHLLRNEGELRGRNGELLIDANFGEKLAYGAGFTPQRVSKMRNFERLQSRHEDKIRQQGIAEADRLAELYAENPGAAAQELSRQAQEDPEFQAAKQRGDGEAMQRAFQDSRRRAANKVAERMERRNFAKDGGRSGTVQSTAGSPGIMHSMGQTAQATETDRLNQRIQVMLSLGVEPQMNDRTFKRAQLIDALITKSRVPRSQAAMIADQMLASS